MKTELGNSWRDNITSVSFLSRSNPTALSSQLHPSNELNESKGTADTSLPLISSSALHGLPATSTTRNVIDPSNESDKIRALLFDDEEEKNSDEPLRNRKSTIRAGTGLTSKAAVVELTPEQESLTNDLYALTTSLHDQALSLRNALRTDSKEVDALNSSIEVNLNRANREVGRLKQWANATCWESCAVTGVMVVIVLVFFMMIFFMKIVPAPR
jgi:hypothetical protein